MYDGFNVEYVSGGGYAKGKVISENEFEYVYANTSTTKTTFNITRQEGYNYYYKLLNGSNNWVKFETSSIEINTIGTILFKKTDTNESGIYIKKSNISNEFSAPKSGYYEIECWGANGGYSVGNGSIRAYGANGGYAKGKILLNAGEKIYVYVGSKGADGVVGKNASGGYNGGGIGFYDWSDDESAGAGGGATDIRLVGGLWDDFESLKSRIMVAGGGRRRMLDKC